MVKVLARSIREFKKPAILTPLLVSVEVIMECAIPFVIANLVNQMQAGCVNGCDCRIWQSVLILMAVISLVFGAGAGIYLRRSVDGLCPESAQRYVL